MRYYIANSKLGFKVRKASCPQCGKKRMSLYFDRNTGALMEAPFGICERVNSCGYHHNPNAVLHDGPEEYKPRPLPPPVEKPTDYRVPMAAFNGTMRAETNTLRDFLLAHCNADDVNRVWKDYRVGTYTGKRQDMHGAAFFWLINKAGELTTGHAIKYLTDGHRDKSQQHDNLWAHHALTGKSASDVGVPECFFGEHLLAHRPDDTVAIVESEKTALIASIHYPGMVWLATGGESKLNRRKGRVLKGRNVILYPDMGPAYQKWRDIATDLSAYFLSEGSLVVSDILECIAHDGDDGLDLADFLIPNLIRAMDVDIMPDAFVDEEQEQPQEVVVVQQVQEPVRMLSPLQRMIEKNPDIVGLIETLKLDVENAVTSYAA